MILGVVAEPLCAPLVISPRLSNYAWTQSPSEGATDLPSEFIAPIRRPEDTRVPYSLFFCSFFFFFINYATRFVIYSTPWQRIVWTL